jgi:hypothetical protein
LKGIDLALEAIEYCAFAGLIAEITDLEENCKNSNDKYEFIFACRWYVHGASAFPLAHHYRAVLGWSPQALAQ